MRRVVEAIVGIFVPGPIGSAFNQLKNWADNILRQWIIEPIELLIELLIDVLDAVPIIGPPLGNAVEYLANLFGLLKDKADNAQTTADSAMQLLAAENADLVDDFERANATSLGSNWTQNYESGNGSLGVKDGYAFWYESGGGTRICRAVYNTPLDADNCSVRMTVAEKAIADVSSPPFLELIARSDSTAENCVVARINRTSVEIGYIISGTYTQMSSASLGQKGLNVLWEFVVGVDGDPDKFELRWSNYVVVSATDSGSVSPRGSGQRHAGFAMRAGNGLTPVFVFAQKRPPNISAWVAEEL